MDLSSRFAQVTGNNIVRIGALEQGKHYQAEHAQRQETMYGQSVQLTLRTGDSSENIKVYLPKRYGLVFTDEDLERINRGSCSYYLIYQGPYPNSRAFKLTLERI
jgi:hypothetical protein